MSQHSFCRPVTCLSEITVFSAHSGESVQINFFTALGKLDEGNLKLELFSCSLKSWVASVGNKCYQRNDSFFILPCFGLACTNNFLELHKVDLGGKSSFSYYMGEITHLPFSRNITDLGIISGQPIEVIHIKWPTLFSKLTVEDPHLESIWKWLV